MRNPSFAAFDTQEYHSRVQKIRVQMEQRGLDAVLLTAKENVVYFSGLETVGWTTKHRPVGLVIAQKSAMPILIVSESLAHVAEATSWIDDVRFWGGFNRPGTPTDPVVAIADALKSLNVGTGRIGMEFGYGMRLNMSIEDLTTLRNNLPNAELTDASEALWALRMIKSPAEIEVIKRVCLDTCNAFQVGFDSMRGGMTERELAGIILAEMSRRTNSVPAFIGIRSGKTKYNMTNVPPFENKVLEPGDLVVVDCGATFRDYNSDVMRMASIGEPTKEQKHFFDVDLAAQKAGMDVIKAGVPASSVAKACVDVIKEGGLGEHALSLERVGHGLGLDVHEPPSLGLGNDFLLQAGMVLTVEPIFSDVPDYEIGNFAMEQTVVVTEQGYELLTPFSDKLWVAPTS